jgi:hypothetical protein
VRAGLVFLHIGVGIVVERLAGLGIEAGRPVQLIDILLAEHEQAAGAVERVVEAVARRARPACGLSVDLASMMGCSETSSKS